MKIDRLMALLIHLINREKATAPELAERFGVSVRTVQRDIDTLSAAGIPVVSMPGYGGGYGILKHYRLDRQLVNTDDLFFMLTSLENVAAALKNRQAEETLEKLRSLVRESQAQEIERRKENLHIDFSALKLGRVSDQYYLLEEAIRRQRVICFDYTDGNANPTQRMVEPMTLVFQWTAWYLYGWCRLRSDYRLFRLSRMEAVEMQPESFTRRERRFEAFAFEESQPDASLPKVVMRFDPRMRVHVKDHFYGADMEEDAEGFLIVRVAFPENGWLYGMLLSYGEFVEVLEPPHLRAILRDCCEKIMKKYPTDKQT